MVTLRNATRAGACLLLAVSSGCSAESGAGRNNGGGEPNGAGGSNSASGGAANGNGNASGGTSSGQGGQSALGGQTGAGGTSSSNVSGGANAATGGANTAAGGTSSSNASGGAPGISGAPPGIGGYAVVVPPSAINAGTPSCGVQSFKRERKPAEVILVLDRSASMKDPPAGGSMQKWDIVEPAVTGIIRTTNASISWGLKLYPESQDTDSCAPETIVPLIHVPIASNNATAVISAINATDPEGDGTPTGDAIKFATAHLKSRSNTNPKYILLATDGDPSCPSGDAATTYAVTAITDALTAGFPTFVIGVDTSKTGSIQRLNQMAIAGGRPRPTTATDTVAFYLASTQAALTSALQTITGEVASCVFELDPPPPVPDNIAVDFSGQRTARDPSRQNGWEYTNAAHTQLEVYGTWCQRIKNEAMNQVEIKYGCPNTPIPLPG
ncbi:MAG: vWA domain-containing protein [Myxococcota bacterium]